ncbi:helix-turn-helix domain-containing protein [Companilactobacillus allii]|uniref:XRE family transcriptional regulator n=1 Tax=Companilactobacillus allii TaxID=1847728 RepID=A0A1P8Q379_9LACO|nr:RodZ domain-containing protein [Companilactobacillus allii]APX72298.1 XRE family transcriptional regulator [Companilactobacillus allii]USQ69390.1 helix-turn-helix domain-containing protein [Companilactobacillus allii]
MDEIGQKLRNARIKKGYTIDDLQQVTKIQKRYLIAIEEGQFDHLPGDFYVRAFIKQYSDAVDISSDDLLEEYKAEIPDSQPKEPVQSEEKKNTRSIKEESSSFFSNLGNYIPQIIVGIIVIVIIGVIAFGMMHKSSSSSNVTIPKDSTEETAKKSSSDTKSTKKATSTKKKSAAKKKSTSLTVKESSTTGTYTVTNLPTDGADVTVSADGGQAWIQFGEGSDTTWQQALSSGEKKTTKITSDVTSFSIQTGNITNTKVSIGGKSVDLSSVSSGSSIVQTLTFNVEND